MRFRFFVPPRAWRLSSRDEVVAVCTWRLPHGVTDLSRCVQQRTPTGCCKCPLGPGQDLHKRLLLLCVQGPGPDTLSERISNENTRVLDARGALLTVREAAGSAHLSPFLTTSGRLLVPSPTVASPFLALRNHVLSPKALASVSLTLPSLGEFSSYFYPHRTAEPPPAGTALRGGSSSGLGRKADIVRAAPTSPRHAAPLSPGLPGTESAAAQTCTVPRKRSRVNPRRLGCPRSTRGREHACPANRLLAHEGTALRRTFR